MPVFPLPEILSTAEKNEDASPSLLTPDIQPKSGQRDQLVVQMRVVDHVAGTFDISELVTLERRKSLLPEQESVWQGVLEERGRSIEESEKYLEDGVVSLPPDKLRWERHVRRCSIRRCRQWILHARSAVDDLSSVHQRYWPVIAAFAAWLKITGSGSQECGPEDISAEQAWSAIEAFCETVLRASSLRERIDRWRSARPAKDADLRVTPSGDLSMNGPDEAGWTDEEKFERHEMERIYRFEKPLVLFETSLGMRGFGPSCMRAGDGLAWVQGISTINVFRGELQKLSGQERESISIYGNVFLDVPSPGMIDHIFGPVSLRRVRVG
ncbi:hypothetical protein LTR37_012976 [Vermiconidia calcicola]|uniref:Uncharacterized protein n=1 Tax=Vermiconidia calcicola TaxID=1690605 RepID=A0ACC3MXJ2_9PEZI|nr:hypothetical protein LTR37_012976 [Vermiconidia calcicola]